MTQPSPTDLEELRRLMSAHCKGPYTVQRLECQGGVVGLVVDRDGSIGSSSWERSEFIALALNLLPALLETAERARQPELAL